MSTKTKPKIKRSHKPTTHTAIHARLPGMNVASHEAPLSLVAPLETPPPEPEPNASALTSSTPGESPPERPAPMMKPERHRVPLNSARMG